MADKEVETALPGVYAILREVANRPIENGSGPSHIDPELLDLKRRETSGVEKDVFHGARYPERNALLFSTWRKDRKCPPSFSSGGDAAMTVHEDRLAEILPRSIQSGAHTTMDDGACVMELVSYVAAEPWSDHPECVSPVIGAFLRSWNDGLPSDADRDRLLKPLIPRVIGSRSPATDEERRAWMALDWLIRVQTPIWLDLAGIVDHARILRELGEIVDEESLSSNAAAWDAANAAAKAAAKAAARAAASDAAWAAAWAAASDAIEPTVAALQKAALELIERMLSIRMTAPLSPNSRGGS